MLPILNVESDNSKKYVVNFRGLNLGEGYQDGEFSDTENVSSVLSPCLTQRYARTLIGTYAAPSTLHAKEKLIVIDGTRVLYDGVQVGTVTEGRKQIATVGRYVVIFPDKVYYDVDNKIFDSMEASLSVAGAVFTASTVSISSGTFPFRVGDAISISGCSAETNNRSSTGCLIIRGVEAQKLTFDSKLSVPLVAGTEAGTVTFKRDIPDLDFICESNYRLWGTKGNIIYSSMYSDPLNFNVYDGIAKDSYAIEVASDGEFTGCIPYSSHICFFKEHTLHKLYGSKPSNFQLVTSQVYGVQAGSERSMRIVNETLLYKGVNGVYAYSGGVPELISPNFATMRYSDACAESDGERYYISMRNGTKWNVFVYDILRSMWLREDGTNCVDMAFHDGHVYLLAASGELYRIDPDGDVSDVSWSVTFTPFTETINERKVYSRFHLRLELGENSWLTVEVRRDNGRWQNVYTTHNERARTITVPVLPERCDSVEIRISGKGACLLRTFVREFQTGSDV